MNAGFGVLQGLRERPIPSLETFRSAKKGYRQQSFDLAHDRAHESFADSSDFGIAGKNWYHEENNPPYNGRFENSIPALFLRTNVIDRLIEVQKRLIPEGLELFVFDAWRPAALQFYMRNVWAVRVLRERHPDWTDAQIEEEIGNYWAVAAQTESDIDPSSPPPHSTGGALDLGLRWKNGEFLQMGTMFDDVSVASHTDAFESGSEESSLLNEDVRMNRRLLYWLMVDAGFVNNPTEWWHYSIGDQMWAKLKSFETGTEVLAYYSNSNPFSHISQVG